MLRTEPKLVVPAEKPTQTFAPMQQQLIFRNGARFQEPLLFVHSKKAIARCVDNGTRLLLVIGYAKHDVDAKGRLIDPETGRWIRHLDYQAWKCIIGPEGVGHPEFRISKTNGKYKPLPVDELIKKGNIIGKNSEPTAFFFPDSLYEQIGATELKCRVANMAAIAGIKSRTKPIDEAQIAMDALAKLTPEEIQVLRTGKYL
jgi:hypothetical protein